MPFCTDCGKEIEAGRFLCDECLNAETENSTEADEVSEAPNESAEKVDDSPLYEEPTFEKPRKTAEKSDLLLAALLAVPSCMLVNSALFSGIGLFFTIATFLISIFSIVYAVKSQNSRITPYSIILALLTVLSSLSFMISDENITKGFLLPTVFILYMTFLTETFSQRSRKAGTYRAVFDMFRTTFVYGLGRLSDGGYAIFRKTDGEGKVSHRRIGNVFIGIAVSLPVILIIVPLLISSDAAFESLFKKLSFDNAAEVIFSIGAGLFIALITFSRLFSLRFYEAGEIKEPSKRGVDPIALISFLGAICAIYVVYLFSQLAYFFSAMGGLLPEDFTASEYARRGFFEMCAVCAINLVIIFLTSAICRKTENGLPVGIKVLNIFLCAFSILLIITAVSKMVLYIDFYGMTRLRIYTSLFMFALAIIFVTVTTKLFVRKIPYMKIILVAIASLLLVTCLADADRIIASYNVNAYLSGRLEEMDVNSLETLNDTATEPLLKLLREADDETVRSAAARELGIRLREHYDIVKNDDGKEVLRRKDSDLRRFNFSEEFALDKLSKNAASFIDYDILFYSENTDYNY